jgi:hypothetical protein
MVFTATLGQEFWRLTIEPTEEEQLRGLENYPKASKWQVDLEAGDCTWYMDGTPSPWSREKVTEAINRCRTETEKARRVNGRFVVEGAYGMKASPEITTRVQNIPCRAVG